MTLPRRARSLALWIGATIAVAVTWFAMRVVIDQTPFAARWWMSTNWLALYFTTPIPFGIVIWVYRRSWRRREFWGVLAGLLLAHCTVHATLLALVDRWRLIWTVLLMTPEVVAMDLLLSRLGFKASQGRSRQISD